MVEVTGARLGENVTAEESPPGAPAGAGVLAGVVVVVDATVNLGEYLGL